MEPYGDIRTFLKDVDDNEILISNEISSGEKIIKTLLVTWMMVTKLNYYT